VKICCIQDVDEAWLAIRHGAVALGLVSAMPSGPGVIGEEMIAQITPHLPPAVASFLLTSRQESASIIAQQRFCRTNTLQLVDSVPMEAYAALREALPGVALVQVIHVVDETALAEARRVAPLVHGLLLDSGNPTLPVKELGGTGRQHNWAISRAIREAVSVPVFLAGGLHAGNVAQAARQVGPFGIDVCSGVRTEGRLDAAKLAAFFGALQEIPAGEAPAGTSPV
jgi:phosphoribosylanthranilate isomerase